MAVETLESSCEVSKRKHGDGSDGTLLDEFSDGDVNYASGVSSKRAKVSREMRFLDEEEDDSDWEEKRTPVESVKWFCVNCTMPNPGDMLCGEHKESGILRHGCFASPFCKDTVFSQVEDKRGGGSSPATSSTAVGFDERMLLHSEFEVKALPHAERPDRLRAIAASLAAAGVFPGRCFPIPAREITKQELQMVHTSEHVDAVDITSQLHNSYFTSDTYANEHSARAARLAAGLCADLATEILSGGVKNGFALVRPPGHHAGIKNAMGFCLHNNAAVAALVAQAAGARKVLIVDWDVHHGNGTQEIFEQNKSVMYISLHRHEGGKFYPGTGAADEVGTNGAEGYCVNVPWSCSGVGDRDYIYAFQHVVLPIASAFSPDFVIVSAGFDAAKGDPLGCCKVTPAGYSRMTQMLGDLCGGKMLVILEGGYNLRSISSSATAVIKVLMGENPEDDFPIATAPPSRACMRTVLDVMDIQMKFWPSLSTSYSKLLSEWEASRPGKRAETQEAVVNAAAPDAQSVAVDEEAPPRRVAPPPAEFAFNFSYSGDGLLIDDKEACGELFRLISDDPSTDLPTPFDDTTLSDLYNEYALSAARSIASVNKMVYEYKRKLRTARAELEEQKKELEEMDEMRRELEEEREKVRAMRLEKKRMKKEAKVLKSEVRRLRKSRTDFVAREMMYKELVAKSASRFEEMRKYVNEQPTFQSTVLELNQISGILSPADRQSAAD